MSHIIIMSVAFTKSDSRQVFAVTVPLLVRMEGCFPNQINVLYTAEVVTRVREYVDGEMRKLCQAQKLDSCVTLGVHMRRGDLKKRTYSAVFT